MTPEQIAGELRSGMTIGIGGFGSRRKPMALVRAIAASDVSDLTIVSYGGPDVGLLVAAGKVGRLVTGFVTLDSIPLEPHFRLARQARRIELTELDEGMLHWGLLAAAHRLPFLPMRAGLGSDVMRVNPQMRTVRSPYADGEEFAAVPALRLDVALVHMNRADLRGNGQYLGPDPYFDDLYCRAADRAFMSCERIVPTAELTARRAAAEPADQPVHGVAAWSRRRTARTSPAACRTTAGTRSSRPITRRPRPTRSAGASSTPPTWPGTSPPTRRRWRSFRAATVRAGRGSGVTQRAGRAAPTLAELCVVACAETWRGDGAILASPMGVIPMLGARLAQLTFEPGLLVTDGEATVLTPGDDGSAVLATDGGRVTEGWIPFRDVFTLLAAGQRHIMMGASQLDQFGNQNISCIGDWARPKAQLIGVRGAPGNTVNHPVSYWVPRHSRRVFVDQVDMVSGVGYERRRGAEPGDHAASTSCAPS